MKEIVLVESRPDLRGAMSGFFRGKGYNVRPFAELHPALDFLERNPRGVEAALAEIRRPELTAPALVNFTRECDLPPVIMAMTDCLRRNPFEIIRYGLNTLYQKPLDMEAAYSTIKNSVRERLCRPGIHCEYFGFLSDTCIQSGFREHIEGRLAEYGFDEKKANAIVLAVDEIYTNAVLHGNYGLGARKNDPDRWDEKFKNIQAAAENPDSPESEAYRHLIDKKVYVDMKFLRRNLLITIRDEGNGFDWQSYPQDGSGKLSPAISGFGITIARKVMDQVMYNDAGNEVTMTATA